MKVILFFVLLCLSIFGLSEFLHTLKLVCIFPKRKLHSYLVVDLKNDIAEKQLLYICEQYIWHGGNITDYIVINADDLDEEKFECCREIAMRYGMKYPERFDF